ncbi:GSCFA domain-containing protein [Altibacter sp. HG106]|uniref:GSCFA domain-containing protein n=1 Tax=Altibacter sp. HG106 TaxID=3023937 RepID=UPI002350EB0B|nr:GSCFA domain-containing protein [Altibacter sp. HG106]MDC7994357.1 GSCFA domain-containing protein [Altibacter sp. HG106]
MNWSTEIPLSPQQPSIDYASDVLLLGSCFAEHIATTLDYFQFRYLSNPFGVLFHPSAIEAVITRAINLGNYTEKDCFQHNDLWHSFEAHSNCSTATQKELLSTLNTALQTLHDRILSASHIVLSFGTAWGYRHVESDQLVANCHKVPQKKFLKELFTPEEVATALENIVVLVREVNPKATVITTVSPVRHLKDGFVENSLSKAHLRAGIHQGIDALEGAYYFPSFEIMMDELREYRFYESDMIHPNQVAIAHIWNRFRTVWISEETLSLQKEIDSIRKGLAHRPFHPNHEAHKSFQQSLQKKMEAVAKKLPYARW